MRLANPERDWQRAMAASSASSLPTIDRAEVERRIGATDEPLELLSGGLRNTNVRVGRDRVLRIRKGDGEPQSNEAALLSRAWRWLRTPSLLASGDDFLLLEYVPHGPLCDDVEHGAAVGRALAEIHGVPRAQLDFVAADLSADGFSWTGYGRMVLRDAAPHLDAALAARIAAFFDEHEAAMNAAFASPVLSHCDFKVSNLHWTPRGELLVLDWEFASIGARLVDIAQLLRWRPPEPFVRAFADAYRAAGGVLVDDWRREAEALDLVNLVGLYGRFAAARSGGELLGRIVDTLERDRSSSTRR